MRISTILFTLLAGSASFAFAQTETLSEELVVRDNGDASIFEGRDFVPEDIFERDAAYAFATGETLQVRDVLDDDEIHELAMRHLGIDERNFDEALETRAAPAALVRVVAQGIKQIIDVIKGMIAKDKERRGKFTVDLINRSKAKYPGYNWVMCHTKHTTKFDGQKGKDWGHRHEEFKVSFGKTIGYEIYYFKSGTFTRQGDGGYLNWAYSGRVKSKSKDGSVVTFSKK